jgi:hypothetical protein
MPSTHSSSLAADFLRQTVLSVLSAPPFNAPSMPPSPECENLAALVSQATLKIARERLQTSQASIAFEATCIQNKALLFESISTVFGQAALDALLAEPAGALLPERSQSSLSAWRFPDDSFILTCKAHDDSFSSLGNALSSSVGALAALGPEGIAKLEKGKLHGWGSFGAFPLSASDMAAFINRLTTPDGSAWLPGSLYILRDSGKVFTPQAMREAIAPLTPATPCLDAALAEVFGRKLHLDAALPRD